jgi:hypothetical protein
LILIKTKLKQNIKKGYSTSSTAGGYHKYFNKHWYVLTCLWPGSGRSKALLSPGQLPSQRLPGQACAAA